MTYDDFRSVVVGPPPPPLLVVTHHGNVYVWCTMYGNGNYVTLLFPNSQPQPAKTSRARNSQSQSTT